MKNREFPIAKRSGEYLAFAIYVIPTLLDGNGYFYYAIDAYNGIATPLGIDRNDYLETILKHIYLLTENSNIIQNKDKGFTLILDEYEEFSDSIRAITNGVNGKLLFNRAYHNHISHPVLKSLGDFLERGLKNYNN